MVEGLQGSLELALVCILSRPTTFDSRAEEEVVIAQLLEKHANSTCTTCLASL